MGVRMYGYVYICVHLNCSGQVVKDKGEVFEVKFLRKRISEKFGAVFSYPPIDDINEVDKNQMTRKVLLKSVKRGIHHFILSDEETRCIE